MIFEGIRDRLRAGREATGIPIPPATLRDRVHGGVDVRGFLTVGRTCAEAIDAALRSHGIEWRAGGEVLDFGCGCGRVLRWFAGRARTVRLFGSDTDPAAIAWCRRKLRFAEFAVNRAEPPLDHPDGRFDLVTAVSVFTHIDADRGDAWLAELARVTRPGGHVIVTTHGPSIAATALTRDERARFAVEGFLFRPPDPAQGVFPKWYGATFHSPEFVRKRFSRWFRVVEHVPRGLIGYQDLVLLAVPAGSPPGPTPR